jgi:hypothetical protein
MSNINLEELNLKAKQRYAFTKELNKKLENGYILSEDDHMELANISKEFYIELKTLAEKYSDPITKFYVDKLPVRYRQFGGNDDLKEKYNYLLLKTIVEKKKKTNHVSDLNKLIVKNLKNKLLTDM